MAFSRRSHGKKLFGHRGKIDGGIRPIFARIRRIHRNSGKEASSKEIKEPNGNLKVRSKKSLCNIFATLNKAAKDYLVLFNDPALKNTENVKGFSLDMLRILERNQRAVEIDSYSAPGISYFIAMSTSLEKPPLPYLREMKTEVLNHWRAIGYLLAASALALRITRATIDIKRWFH